MAKASSINFKKSKFWQTIHNTEERPNYVIDSIEKIEFDRKAKEANLLREKIIKEAKENYAKTCKNRNKTFKAKSFEWSAVINLNEKHTMSDVKKVVDYLENEYKIQCYQIAIHRDEGHIENNQKKINHHAHLEFITLDKECGQQQFQIKRATSKSNLRKMQTEVAKILGMQRGEDKRISGIKRIEPRVWAAMKEQEKRAIKEKTAELTNDNEIKNYALDEVNSENKKLENLITHYQIKRRKTAQTIKKLRAENKEIPKLIKELNEAKKTKIEALKNTGTAQKSDYDLIHKEIHAQNEALKETKKKNEARIKELEEQIKELQNALKTRDEAHSKEIQELSLEEAVAQSTKECFEKLKKAQSSQQEQNAQEAAPREKSNDFKEQELTLEEAVNQSTKARFKNLNDLKEQMAQLQKNQNSFKFIRADEIAKMSKEEREREMERIQNKSEQTQESNLSSNSYQNTTRTRKMR